MDLSPAGRMCRRHGPAGSLRTSLKRTTLSAQPTPPPASFRLRLLWSHCHRDAGEVPGEKGACMALAIEAVRNSARSAQRPRSRSVLTSLELFTGAGGLALGTHAAGFKHVA